jgi:hypothetical protein
MTTVVNVRGNLSSRAATGTREHVVRPVRRRPLRGVHVDGRRPARLVPAPFRSATRSCEPVPRSGSLGWLVLVGVLTFLVVLGTVWATGGGGDATPVPTRTVLVQVHQGESLWQVARRTAPSSSAAAVVDTIRQLNGLDDNSILYPGELLRVPGAPATAAPQR